jgi:D-proline reductase (dithiol) PrdB
LRRAALPLVTTGGVQLTPQPPFDMIDPDGDPSFREVPVDTRRELLRITHG